MVLSTRHLGDPAVEAVHLVNDVTAAVNFIFNYRPPTLAVRIVAHTENSLLVGEDQRVSAAACNLNHFGPQRLDERQSHRGGFQHVVVALMAAVLCALEAQLRVLVQAHAPQLDHIFGRRSDESEAVTTSSRGDLLCGLQAIRSQLVFAGLLPAAVRHHEAGDPQSAGEAEAPHKHLVGGLLVLADVLKNWTAAGFLLLGSGCFTECRITTDLKPRADASGAQSHAWKSHPVDRERTSLHNCDEQQGTYDSLGS